MNIITKKFEKNNIIIVCIILNDNNGISTNYESCIDFKKEFSEK